MGWFNVSINETARQHPLWVLLLVLRIPIIAVFGFTLLVLDVLIPDVAYDTVRYVVLDVSEQLAVIAVLLLLATYALRIASDTTIAVVAPDLREAGSFSVGITWLAPRLIAIVPGFVTGFKFLEVGLNLENFTLPGRTDEALYFQSLALLSAAIFLCIGVGAALIPTSGRPRHGDTIWGRVLALPLYEWAALLALLALAIGAFFLFWDWTWVAPAQFVGPFGVALLWVFAAVMYFNSIAILAHITRVPWILLLVVAAFLFSLLNLNDNHTVRTVSTHAEPDGLRYFQKSADYITWFEAREKLDLYDYEHYPVIIIATEGGALRSAYFTARLIQTLQDICPVFASHIFAISGVSGGSVGAASMLAQNLRLPELRKPVKEPCILDRDFGHASRQIQLFGKPDPNAVENKHSKDPKPAFDAVKSLYSTDLMSPLLGATLFPDAFQRIWPRPIEAFDRARAWECAFETALEGSISGIWNSKSDGSVWGDDRKVRRPNVGAPCQGDSAITKAKGFLPLSYFYEYLSESRGGVPPINIPYLFTATTSVDTGASVPVVSFYSPYTNVSDTEMSAAWEPFEFAASSNVTSVSVQQISAAVRLGSDLPLSSAALLSARFPYITPAGTILTQEQDNAERADSQQSPARQLRFVDGGMFENSGVWFANNIIFNLHTFLKDINSFTRTFPRSPIAKQLKAKPEFLRALLNIRVFLLVLRSTPCEQFPIQNVSRSKQLELEEKCHNEDPSYSESEGLHELTSTFRALYRTRATRGNESIANVKTQEALSQSVLSEEFDRCKFLAKVPDEEKARTCREELSRRFTGPIWQPLPVEVNEVRVFNGAPLHLPLSWVLSSKARSLYDQAIRDVAVSFWPENPFSHGPLRTRTADKQSDTQGRTGAKNVVCALYLTDRRKMSDEKIKGGCDGVEPEWLYTVETPCSDSSTIAAPSTARQQKEMKAPLPIGDSSVALTGATPECPTADDVKIPDPPPPPPPPPGPKPTLPTMDTCENCTPER